MAERRPDGGRTRQGQGLSQGLLRARTRHLDQDRRASCADPARQSRHRLHRAAQRPDRRRHASTTPSARRQALLDQGGLLVTVVGRPKGVTSKERRAATAMWYCSRTRSRDSDMPRLSDGAQAIDRSRRGADDVRRRRWRAPARRSPGCARAMPTAACRCCGCRRSATTSPPSCGYAARLRDGATDMVFLGTGGSSLGGQTLAQLARLGVPGVGALRDAAAHAFHGQSRPRHLRRAAGDGCRSTTTRFVAISKSGGTGETLMQTIAALDGGEGGRPRSAHPDMFLGITEPAKAGKAQRPARSAWRASASRMLDHDPGVGGRFSVLTNVGLLPAAVSVSTSARSAPAPPRRWRRCWRASPPPTCRPRSAPRSSVALRAHGKTIAVLMAYADRLRALHHAGTCSSGPKASARTARARRRSARSGRSISTASCSSTSPARATSCSPIVTVAAAGPGPRIDADLAKLAGEPDFAGKTIGDLVAAQGRATAETLAKNGCPVRTIHLDRARRAQPRRTADAFHAGDDHRRASARRRCVRPAGGGRGQGAGEEVSGRLSVP